MQLRASSMSTNCLRPDCLYLVVWQVRVIATPMGMRFIGAGRQLGAAGSRSGYARPSRLTL